MSKLDGRQIDDAMRGFCDNLSCCEEGLPSNETGWMGANKFVIACRDRDGVFGFAVATMARVVTDRAIAERLLDNFRILKPECEASLVQL